MKQKLVQDEDLPPVLLFIRVAVGVVHGGGTSAVRLAEVGSSEIAACPPACFIACSVQLFARWRAFVCPVFLLLLRLWRDSKGTGWFGGKSAAK